MRNCIAGCSIISEEDVDFVLGKAFPLFELSWVDDTKKVVFIETSYRREASLWGGYENGCEGVGDVEWGRGVHGSNG